jgi:glycerol-3-phosphate O-acyltransferase
MLPPKSPPVLRSFIEAYAVVAETLALDGDAAVDPDGLQSRCLKMGEQLFHRGEIRNREAITTALYASGIQLAANRGLLDADATARQSFRREVGDILIALNAISSTDD